MLLLIVSERSSFFPAKNGARLSSRKRAIRYFHGSRWLRLAYCAAFNQRSRL